MAYYCYAPGHPGGDRSPAGHPVRASLSGRGRRGEHEASTAVSRFRRLSSVKSPRSRRRPRKATIRCRSIGIASQSIYWKPVDRHPAVRCCPFLTRTRSATGRPTASDSGSERREDEGVERRRRRPMFDSVGCCCWCCCFGSTLSPRTGRLSSVRRSRSRRRPRQAATAFDAGQ